MHFYQFLSRPTKALKTLKTHENMLRIQNWHIKITNILKQLLYRHFHTLSMILVKCYIPSWLGKTVFSCGSICFSLVESKDEIRSLSSASVFSWAIAGQKMFQSKQYASVCVHMYVCARHKMESNQNGFMAWRQQNHILKNAQMLHVWPLWG